MIDEANDNSVDDNNYDNDDNDEANLPSMLLQSIRRAFAGFPIT